MKKLLSLIILLMLVSSLAFATNKEYRLDEISRCKKDGHLKCDVEDNLVNGIVKEFNKDGSLTSEISYKEGMLNGISKNYDNKGNLWIERNYKNGEKDGPENRSIFLFYLNLRFLAASDFFLRFTEGFS